MKLRKRVTQAGIEDIQKYYKKGLSNESVARMTGYSVPTVLTVRASGFSMDTYKRKIRAWNESSLKKRGLSKNIDSATVQVPLPVTEFPVSDLEEGIRTVLQEVRELRAEVSLLRGKLAIASANDREPAKGYWWSR